MDNAISVHSKRMKLDRIQVLCTKFQQDGCEVRGMGGLDGGVGIKGRASGMMEGRKSGRRSRAE